MRSVAYRFAAVVALGTLLVCSNVGTCWLRLAASSGHDCCEQDSTMKAAPKPCGSTATSVPLTELPAPLAWVSAVPALPLSATAPSSLAAFAPAFPVLAPPLILRI